MINRTIMDQYIKDEGVKARLKMIRERDSNVWEKYLQAEVEYYITKNGGILVERVIEAFPVNRMLHEKALRV